MMDFDWGQSSLVGNRKNNQDRCGLSSAPSSVLVSLADGMGGHPKGEAAAQLVVDTCQQLLETSTTPILNPGSFLTRTLHKAHEKILEFGWSQIPPIDPRTTSVAALIQDGIAYWAYTGDSRLYLFRNGKMATRTIDHSYVERLRRQGIISEDELQTHPHRNYVTRCLGGNIPSPDITLGHHQLRIGDILMLCSDGLWGSIDINTITEALCSSMSMSEATEVLANEAAQKAYPESDNVTIIALKVGDLGQPAKPQQKAEPATGANSNDLATAIADLQSAIDNFESEKE